MALNNYALRYGLLGILVIQNTVTILCIRFSRMVNAPPNELIVKDGIVEPSSYIMSTLVLTTECFKICLIFTCLTVFHANYSVIDAIKVLYKEVVGKPKDTLMVAIPGVIYVIQDNLVIFALSCLDAATYQVTYQARIVTTALFAKFLLKKALNLKHWIALIILTCGVILAQFNADEGKNSRYDNDEAKYFLGLMAVVCATLTSGFAGIYNEKLLKDGRQPVLFIRSFQLSIFAILFAMIGVFVKDRAAVTSYGVFHRYTPFTFFLALLQASGGILVAATMKFADNILKTFATSISIIFSCLLSYFLLGDLKMSLPFALGTVAIIYASYLYGQASAPKTLPSEKSATTSDTRKLKAH